MKEISIPTHPTGAGTIERARQTLMHGRKEARINQPAPVSRVMAVTSGKGGVGKTAVVANLAILFARMQQKVLILDADLGLANVDIFLGLAPPRNLNHFFAGNPSLESILIKGPEGIRILPAGSGCQMFTRLDARQKLRLLSALEAMRDQFDIVLIDTEAGISENVTYFATAAQEILVVTTPCPAALSDAYALMKLFSTQYHERKFHLVVNFSKRESDALEVFRKLTLVADRYLDISINYLGSIPPDEHMTNALKEQKVVVENAPGSKSGAALSALARALMQGQHEPQPKGSIQFFWKRLMDFTNNQGKL